MPVINKFTIFLIYVGLKNYIADTRTTLFSVQIGRRLRSTDVRQLYVPRIKTEFEMRAFAVAGQSTWNTLPRSIREFLLIDSEQPPISNWLQSVALNSFSTIGFSLCRLDDIHYNGNASLHRRVVVVARQVPQQLSFVGVAVLLNTLMFVSRLMLASSVCFDISVRANSLVAKCCIFPTSKKDVS